MTRAPRVSYTARALIAQKRDGGELEPAAIRWLVRGFVAGAVADYQMSAFAMAVLLRGMTREETLALTLAMRDSGRLAKLGRRGGAKIDKHSTGGVGDKVSICLAPLVASCGVRVPMICGRGLGHTGGTIDKLEAIPGFAVDQPLHRFEALVNQHGSAIIAQTADLAPADRKLYALRDVTATVESIPLITASILSKKLSEDLDGLVLDVKVGRGAFMKTLDDARALAGSIVSVGAAAGLRTTALLTRMDTPLGYAVGNALETAEAFALLTGSASDDLYECTLALGEEMLLLAGVAKSKSSARNTLERALRDGSAAARMEAIVRAQGGDPRVVREPDRLPRAKVIASVAAPRNGYVADVDALQVAHVALQLGAGRLRVEDAIDPSVGVVLHKRAGARLRAGEALFSIHARSRTELARARAAMLAAYSFSPTPQRRPALVRQVLHARRSRNPAR